MKWFKQKKNKSIQSKKVEVVTPIERIPKQDFNEEEWVRAQKSLQALGATGCPGETSIFGGSWAMGAATVDSIYFYYYRKNQN